MSENSSDRIVVPVGAKYSRKIFMQRRKYRKLLHNNCWYPYE